MDNLRKETKNPAVEGSAPGSGWTGLTEDGDIKGTHCPAAGTCQNPASALLLQSLKKLL